MFQDERDILEAEIYKLSPTAQELMKKFFAELDELKKSLLKCNGDLPHEIWRDICGYEGLYKVSNFGRVKSLHCGREKLLKAGVSNTGYANMSLTKTKTKKNFHVHALVAGAFLPNPEGKRELNHIDGNKTNNRVENLEWITGSENTRHAIQNGQLKIKKGSQCRFAKLTDEQVRYIRRVYIPRHHEFGQLALARRFNVSSSTIYEIISGKYYATPEVELTRAAIRAKV